MGSDREESLYHSKAKRQAFSKEVNASVMNRFIAEDEPIIRNKRTLKTYQKK